MVRQRLQTIPFVYSPVNLGSFNHTTLNSLIENSRPDIVAIQEFSSNQKIKSLEGWNHLFEGDLHILSKFPLVKGDFRQMKVPLHTWPRSSFSAVRLQLLREMFPLLP